MERLKYVRKWKREYKQGPLSKEVYVETELGQAKTDKGNAKERPFGGIVQRLK